jgi:hypothetical protein
MSDIEQVMAELVHGVNCDPAQRALERGRVGVHQGALPIRGLEAGEIIGEKTRRVCELPRDVGRSLIGVSVVQYALVAAHGIEGWPLHAPGREHPFPLNEQHIANVTAVLEWRPFVQTASPAEIRRAVGQNRGNLVGIAHDRGAGPRCFIEVVLESTLVAAIHGVTLRRGDQRRS